MNKSKTIVFTESVTPEDIEYIDSLKEIAQADTEYWQILKDMLSKGYITYEHEDNVTMDESDNQSDKQSDNQSDYSNSDNDIQTIKSLLEYQSKMLENINYSIDFLIKQYKQIKQQYDRLENQTSQTFQTTTNPMFDLSGIINIDRQFENNNRNYNNGSYNNGSYNGKFNKPVTVQTQQQLQQNINRSARFRKIKPVTDKKSLTNNKTVTDNKTVTQSSSRKIKHDNFNDNVSNISSDDNVSQYDNVSHNDRVSQNDSVSQNDMIVELEN